MRTIRWSAAVVALLATLVAGRADAALRWLQAEVCPYAGFWILDETIALQEKPMVGARGGLTFFKRFGIEGHFGTMDTERPGLPGFDFQLDHFGADLVLNLLPQSGFNPYLVGGWNQLNRNPESGETLRMGGYEFGGGAKIRLAAREGLRIDLRVDARDVLVTSDTPLLDPGVTKAHVLISGGIHLSVSDADQDSDQDGILDRLDRCPATPLGAVVDPLGCPQDRDEDRVPDGLDACPYTPFGAVVDETGCSRDTDQDGVYDGLDRCERTPEGVRVDVVGCPVDSDGDGVYDGPDQCPGTPLGVVVDPQGCPIPESPQEKELLDTGTLRLDNIYFEEGSAELKTESHAPLDAVGEILARWPQLEIEIGGHTDAQGDDEFNLVLSRSRAQAVYDYLASHFPGLRLGQFVVRGYGETQPVASNETLEGRTANRRVEFRILNRGVLKR